MEEGRQKLDLLQVGFDLQLRRVAAYGTGTWVSKAMSSKGATERPSMFGMCWLWLRDASEDGATRFSRCQHTRTQSWTS